VGLHRGLLHRVPLQPSLLPQVTQLVTLYVLGDAI
jgi:hypothetical protein